MDCASYSVLAIDDDRDRQASLRSQLADIDGWSVELRTCPSIRTALPWLRKHEFNVVLLDHRVSKKDGLVVLEFLVESAVQQFLPVIMLTGDEDSRFSEDAIRTGVVDCFPGSLLSSRILRSLISNAITKAGLREELSAQYRELEQQARVDDLTNILNRRAFDEALAREFYRARRFDRTLSLVMLDLDHFKHVNDQYGHEMGDMVLQQTASCISQSTRAHDTSARWGGEEFAILLSDTDADGALVFAERLRGSIGEITYQADDGVSFQVTCSIGIARWTSTMEEPGEMVRVADAALYRAKEGGRDCVSS